jgi:hypothetical protein
VALTVSPAIRIVALLGLLLALGAGGAMHFMGGSGSDSVSSAVPARNPAVVHAKSVAAQASARAKNPTKATATKPTHKAAVANTAKPAAAAHAEAPAKTAAPATPAPASGAKTPTAPAVSSVLPLPLAQALAVNPTVVAIVYNPQSEVDGIAVAEARAGAALAGAGFVALSVLSQRDVGKLTEQLGLLPDPSVLVFTRPSHLAAKLEGFADKQTVAQAAQNAARGT